MTRSASPLLAQVAAEVGNSERDPAAFAGVDQALLHQRVAGRGERLRLLVEEGGDVRGGDGADVVGAELDGGIGHRSQVVPLRGGGALVARTEEADRQLALGLGGGDL